MRWQSLERWIPAAGWSSEEWAVARRYMSAETLTKARMRLIDGDPEEVIQHQLTEAV